MWTIRYKDHYPFSVAPSHYPLVESEEYSGTLWEGPPLLCQYTTENYIYIYESSLWKWHFGVSYIKHLRHHLELLHLYPPSTLSRLVSLFAIRIFFHAEGTIGLSSHNSSDLRDEEVSFQGNGSFPRNFKRPGPWNLRNGEQDQPTNIDPLPSQCSEICLKDHSHHPTKQ